MYSTITLAERGYRFIPAVFQYSGGVAALPGWRLERVRFADPVPLAAGFARIADYLKGRGLPLTAFCACELRSPAPFTDAGFRSFNKAYAGVLGEWGVLTQGHNPVARSNVCPAISPPAEPGFHAFTFALPDAEAGPSFVVAGSGESLEGKATYAESTVAYRDLSPAGIRAKAEYVLGEMERRMAALDATWQVTTGVQVYTVHDIHPLLGDELVRRGAARHGVTWQHCRPPVVDLEYEMDCRGLPLERVLP
ncbi:2-amino-5-chloromuconate deaminase CnbZ [Belnapia rosea]|uniref:2-amino-5-chloromuconate deaminase CnbZ n=1 Tax=Belnapia rosea TaxID=938405 RepID=UPI0008923EA3|nr:hypothetical protein [Belnapia rosea]SDB53992.1 hypothetical protein SAMN02927895_02029 [Belnapia rosea]